MELLTSVQDHITINFDDLSNSSDRFTELWPLTNEQLVRMRGTGSPNIFIDTEANGLLDMDEALMPPYQLHPNEIDNSTITENGIIRASAQGDLFYNNSRNRVFIIITNVGEDDAEAINNGVSLYAYSYMFDPDEPDTRWTLLGDTNLPTVQAFQTRERFITLSPNSLGNNNLKKVDAFPGELSIAIIKVVITPVANEKHTTNIVSTETILVVAISIFC